MDSPAELLQPASLRDRQRQLTEHPWEPAAANAAFLPDLERPAKRSRTDASPDFKAAAVNGDQEFPSGALQHCDRTVCCKIHTAVFWCT